MERSLKKPKPTTPTTPAGSVKPKGLVEFFRESPLIGVDLDLERDRDAGRDIKF